MRTALIQSGFRYDFDKETVKKGIKDLTTLLPKGEARDVSPKEEKMLIGMIPAFEKAYRSVIEDIAPMINTVAGMLPKRRERVQHIGLFGYSRGVGKVTLPRAIGFTAALYSVGIPPEFIGTGRPLKSLSAEEKKILEKHYINLKNDIIRAGNYLNKENLEKLTKKYPSLKNVQEDIKELEKYFNITLEPKSLKQKEHQILTSVIVEKLDTKENLTDFIVRAAKLRRSLG